MQLDLNSLLAQVTVSLEVEREWVDLLSQLEYVGARKILKAVPFEKVDFEVVRHLSEEANHCLLLKVAAKGLGLADRPWSQGCFAAVGWNYFRNLDLRVSPLVDGSENAYRAVSWAIERRVAEVYPAYEALTKQSGVKRALRIIMAQEQRHLAMFDPIEENLELSSKIIAIEESLWREFVKGISQTVPQENSHRVEAVS